MKFANFNYVDYTDEEIEQRERAKAKNITFDDLRKFLKSNELGFKLSHNMFDGLDYNVFQGNGIVYIQDAKTVLWVKSCVDLIIKYGPNYRGKNPEEKKYLDITRQFFEEIGTTDKKVYKLFTRDAITTAGHNLLEDKKIEFFGRIDSHFTYRAGITPEIIDMRKYDSNTKQIAKIDKEWKNYVDSRRQRKSEQTLVI